MLLRFGAKNFFSFKDWVTVDLSFNEKVEKEVSNGSDFAKIMCFKGANSSGKTNALRILPFLSTFCRNSFNRKPEDALQLDTFFDNDLAAEFFVDFRLDSVEYSLEVEVTQTTVIAERLYRKEKRKTLVLSRIGNKIEKNTLFDAKREIVLRANASVISTARQYEIAEFNPIYDFFGGIRSNVGYLGLRHDFLDSATLSSFYSTNPEVLEFVKRKIVDFDTGITDIEVQSYENDKKEKVFYPVFTHTSGEGFGRLLYHAQSSGTKSLYLYLAFYYLTLQQGGVLVLDEFDINLHPDILPHLVDIFEDKAQNKTNAQLVFSTHNTDVLDLMGKYRTYVFNKENGASYAYRLDELPANVIRNDRPITPLYRAGKIGGVPRI